MRSRLIWFKDNWAIAKRTIEILGLALLVGWLLLVPAISTPAQSTSSTTWAVSIVLPARLVSGQPATLAVLGVDGRLAPNITVKLGNDQRVKTDKTGRASFTAPMGGSVLIATAAGNSAAALVDPDVSTAQAHAPIVAPVVSQFDEFPIYGTGFSGDADSNHVTLNDDRAFVLAASPECLTVLASPRAIPGPAKISIETPGGQWSAATTLVSLHFDPPLPALVPEKRSKLALHVQGSDQALRILVENKTPGVLRFLRGDRQEVLTSGGAQNSADVAVQAITTGDFSFHARILAAPDVDAARRYLTAAASLAPKDLQRATRNIAERLTQHPHDTQKAGREIDQIMSTTMSGDYRTLLESAASALE
ncbi:MAG: hypothetical protein WAN14_10810 [Candidatus Acidiferrales bacterium]